VFDSVYDDYRGAVLHVRVVDGRLAAGARVRMMQGGTVHEVVEVGRFAPGMQKVEELAAGEVGYLIAGIKGLKDVQVGDTVVTSGFDGVYPKGLRIGRVSDLSERSSDIFYEITVTPFVDFEKLEEVLVILRPETEAIAGEQ